MNISNWVELSGLLRNLSLTTASLVAIYVGLFGLRSWQDQKKWERKHEVASHVLESVHFYHELLDELKEIMTLAKMLGEENDRAKQDKIKEKIDLKFTRLYSEKARVDRKLSSSIVQAHLLFDLNILTRTRSITQMTNTELAKAEQKPLHEAATEIESANIRDLITTLEVEITSELYAS